LSKDQVQISAAIVGRESGPEPVPIDLRWLMAYNAALGELGEAAHALFPVCYEWPANRTLREASGLQALNERLVHAQHDLVIHRAPRAGETLQVSGRVISVAQRRPGAFVVLRMRARDASGDAVSTTDYGMLYRGVGLQGAERALESAQDPPQHGTPLQPVGEIAVAATAAHVYTECARIWNPIHTEPEYARKAGLPGIILHGTATLALSVSKVIQTMKTPVRRVRCRFAGMVRMPSTLTVHASRVGDAIAFETRNDEDVTVIERGWIG
jgi:acyl dehydratase